MRLRPLTHCVIFSIFINFLNSEQLNFHAALQNSLRFNDDNIINTRPNEVRQQNKSFGQKYNVIPPPEDFSENEDLPEPSGESDVVSFSSGFRSSVRQQNSLHELTVDAAIFSEAQGTSTTIIAATDTTTMTTTPVVTTKTVALLGGTTTTATTTTTNTTTTASSVGTTVKSTFANMATTVSVAEITSLATPVQLTTNLTTRKLMFVNPGANSLFERELGLPIIHSLVKVVTSTLQKVCHFVDTAMSPANKIHQQSLSGSFDAPFFDKMSEECPSPCPDRNLLIAYAYPDEVLKTIRPKDAISNDSMNVFSIIPSDLIGTITGELLNVIILIDDIVNELLQCDVLSLKSSLREDLIDFNSSLEGFKFKPLNQEILYDEAPIGEENKESIPTEFSNDLAALQRNSVMLRLLAKVTSTEKDAAGKPFMQRRSLEELEVLTVNTSNRAFVADPPLILGNTNENKAIPFFTKYLSTIHMESLKAPSKEFADMYIKILEKDPDVAFVYRDEVIDFSDSIETSNGERYSEKKVIESEIGTDELQPENDQKRHSLLNSRQMKHTIHPNDRFFEKQWALESSVDSPGATNAVNGWNIWRGESKPKVTIALIDSGVDLTHKDLASRLWKNEGEICDNGIDDDGNGYIDDCAGWDFVEEDNYPQDEGGHGTACAGIISAAPNNGLGIAPVCWNCEIMNLRTLDANVYGSPDKFIRAIDYALQKKVKISNNSYGIKKMKLPPLEEAVKRSQKAGMVFVAAAGNRKDVRDNLEDPLYPGSYSLDNIISVAALNKTGQLAHFSYYGFENVHIGAPGEDILAPTLGGAYQFTYGTSIAAPHVTALAGLILGQEPNIGYKELIKRILDGVRPLKGLQGKIKTGGALDIFRSLSFSNTPDECSEGHLSGFVKGSCNDINECEATPPFCQSYMRCVNLPGTFECRCPDGFVWNNLKGIMSKCLRIDFPTGGPCSSKSVCGPNSLCQILTNRPFGQLTVSCKCVPGYVKHLHEDFCVPQKIDVETEQVSYASLGVSYLIEERNGQIKCSSQCLHTVTALT